MNGKQTQGAFCYITQKKTEVEVERLSLREMRVLVNVNKIIRISLEMNGAVDYEILHDSRRRTAKLDRLPSILLGVSDANAALPLLTPLPRWCPLSEFFRLMLRGVLRPPVALPRLARRLPFISFTLLVCWPRCDH